MKHKMLLQCSYYLGILIFWNAENFSGEDSQTSCKRLQNSVLPALKGSELLQYDHLPSVATESVKYIANNIWGQFFRSFSHLLIAEGV